MNLNHKTIILTCFVFLFFSCNKNKKMIFLESSSSDSIDIYIRIAQDINLQEEIRQINNKKAYSILYNQSNSQSNRENLLTVANVFLKCNNHNDFSKTINVLINRAIEVKDTSMVANSYNKIGNHYIDLNKNDSAYVYITKAEKFYLKLNDSLNLAKNYLDKGYIQLSIGDFSSCIQSSIRSLGYLKKSNEFKNQYLGCNYIGISSGELKDYTNAIIYHKKALEIVKKLQDSQKFHFSEITLNNIGVIYQNLNNHAEAIKSFTLALNEAELLNDNPDLYSKLIDNLAYSKFKSKDNNGLPKLFFKSLKIREKNNLPSGIIVNKIHLSEFFAKNGDTVNSQKYAIEALKLAKETKVSGDLLSSLKQLSLVEHRNAGKYSKEYIKISDSLQIEERKSKDKFARIAFETDEIIQEKDKLAEQNRSLLYFFIGTLFVGLLLFVIRTQRAKNRELLLKQQQQKVNEEIYNLMISQQATIEENRVKEKKRIAQELHDGVLGRLFGARLNLDSLNRFSDDESITSRFNYLAELKNIEQDIREISHDLNREKYVLINNFVAIVSNLIEEQTNSFEAELTSSLDESIQWDKVSNAVKINLYRILQESLQNINKYASAKHISVEFKKENDQIVFTITDDGIGFDVNTKKRGIGLQNMQSRVNECEGTFDIKSKKGKGTTTVVAVPIEKKNIEVE